MQIAQYPPIIPLCRWLRAAFGSGIWLRVDWRNAVSSILTGVKRGTCDFMNATEGEMKKVSWSSRNELIGSTKVVIAATIFLGGLLFVVDAAFIKFFQFIGVLRSGM